MELSDKKKAALKTAIVALVVGFVGEFAEPTQRLVEFLLSFF